MHQRDRSGVTISRCVLAVLKEKVIPVPQFVENFLPTVIKYLEHEDEGVVSMWSATLIEAIPLLPVDVLQAHVAPVAFQRSQPTKPQNLRINSCSILGELSQQYDPTLLKKDLLPICLSLCQDESPAVRAAVCALLEKVIKRLKGDSFKTTLGPSLVELGSDEAIKVKEAAFITAVNILDVVEKDDVLTTLIPLLKRIIQYGFMNDDNILLPIANRFGEMCLGIKNVTDEKQVFVKYFAAIAGIGLPQSLKKSTIMFDSDYQIKFPSMIADETVLCRQAAAAHLPAIISFCDGDDELVDSLIPVLDNLCSDPSLMVRRTIGTGIAEITPLVNHISCIGSNLIKLLNEDAEEVLEGFVPSLSTLINTLRQRDEYFNTEIKVSPTSELNMALLKCESLISTSRNWRLYCDFLNQIRVMADILPAASLYADYVLLFLKRMHTTRTVPVRLALMETVLFFLRRLPMPEYRSKTIETIIQDFCRSTNFYNRIFYLRSCNLILNMYSVAFFKKYFFSSTISLVDDAVPNIRWTLMKMLPKLEHVVTRDPSPDDTMKQQLESAIAKLKNDNDREIFQEMNRDVIVLEQDVLECFGNDLEKFVEETKLGEYIPDAPTAKTVIASKIPRSPSSNSSLTSSNKAVLRRKPVEPDPNKNADGSIPKETTKERYNVATENSNKLTAKSFKRAIPVSRAAKSHSAPNSRQGSFKDKRLSLDEIDMNKNMHVIDLTGQQRPSQLPRPLSCINFSTRPSAYSKKSNSSKLPVSRSSALTLSK